jgi:hypothetical protein
MTIRLYIEQLISEGHQIARVAIPALYGFTGTSMLAGGFSIVVEIRDFEEPDVCEFYSQSGTLVARARGFDGAI